ADVAVPQHAAKHAGEPMTAAVPSCASALAPPKSCEMTMHLGSPRSQILRLTTDRTIYLKIVDVKRHGRTYLSWGPREASTNYRARTSCRAPDRYDSALRMVSRLWRHPLT